MDNIVKITQRFLLVLVLLPALTGCRFSLSDLLPRSGAVDTSFGMDGIVTTNSDTDEDDAANGIAVQDDGKIVLAGSSGSSSSFNFALARYCSDGSLDTSFGTAGKVITPFGSTNDKAAAVAVQQNNKIVAAGHSSVSSIYNFALARYNPDGSLDTSFGSSGKVYTDFYSAMGAANALAIQPDGKIVAAGYSNNGSFDVFALARYNPDGSLDAAFDTDGKVRTDFGPWPSYCHALAVQKDGKIVAAGTVNNTIFGFALVRYNTDGSLDTSFGVTGKVITFLGANSAKSNAVVIQEDGKIVAAGYRNTGSDEVFALVRYHADGSLDSSFGTSGTGSVLTPIGSGNSRACAAALQSDGKIVAAGYSDTVSFDNFVLVRYNSNGTLDTSFGTDGIVIQGIGPGDSRANALAINPDGMIIAGGEASNAVNSDFALARFWP